MGWCISQGKARGDMTVEERIGAADRRKMDGNALFKEEKLEEAMQQYEMVTHLVPSIYCFFAWVHVYVYIYIYICFLSKFWWFFLTSGHRIYGWRLHVPVVWEVPGHGFSC